MSDRTTDILAMNSASATAEPSMEDILASIRRIIADDDVAPAVSAPEISDNLDISVLASTSPEIDDQNTVITEAETPSNDFHDLEDILVLSDEEFSSEDLQIPAIPIPEHDLDDDILIADTDVLNVEPAEELRDKAELSDNKSLTKGILDQIMPADGLSSDMAAAPRANLDVDEDIFTEFGDDIDLILDQEDGSSLTPEAYDSDGSEVLGIVEAGIADIESRVSLTGNDAALNSDISLVEGSDEAEGANMSLQSETPYTPSVQDDDDDIIDLVGDLLARTDEAPVMDPIPVPEVEDVKPIAVAMAPVAALGGLAAMGLGDDGAGAGNDDIFSSIESEPAAIGGDEDIDLVKSLMAELTDDTLLDISDSTEVEPLEAENDTDYIEPEAELVDDIVDQAIADELALADSNDEVLPVVEVSTVSVETSEFTGEAVVASASEVDSVDATINALLQIAASAESDADSVEDELSERIADGPPELETHLEETLMDDLPEMSATEPVAEVEDVDMVLTPESKPVIDEIDAIFAPSLDHMDDDAPTEPDSEDLEAILPDMTLPTEPVLDSDYVDPIAIPDQVDPEIALSSDTLSESESTTQAELEPEADVSAEVGLETDMPDVSAMQTLADQPIDPIPPLEEEPSEMPKLVAKDGIIDEITETAAAEAFASLNQVVEENTEYQESGPRIGDLVQDALRPMLKDWLDENLKGIVERAVTKEVKRISSGK